MTIRATYGMNPVSAYIDAGIKTKFDYEIKSNELVGIEVEVENATGHARPAKTWSAKEDNSLRNGGVEFVSKPIRASDAPHALLHLAAHTLGKECCFSPRTSVHVHLNFQDQTMDQVKAMLMVYTIVEKMLYRFVGRQRSKNIFCVPVVETDLLVNMVLTREPRLDRWQKYCGINLVPLTNYGTIEFRHMHGSKDVRKLSIWIDLLVRMKAYVLSQGYETIVKKVQSMQDAFDFNGWVNEVFGDIAHELKYSGIDDVRHNYRAAKLIASPTMSRTYEAVARDVTSSSAFFKVKA